MFQLTGEEAKGKPWVSDGPRVICTFINYVYVLVTVAGLCGRLAGGSRP